MNIFFDDKVSTHHFLVLVDHCIVSGVLVVVIRFLLSELLEFLVENGQDKLKLSTAPLGLVDYQQDYYEFHP